MKAIYIVPLSILLGSCLGVGMTWSNFHDAPPLSLAALGAGPRRAAELWPKAHVDSRYHDFGKVEHDSKLTHVFEITNLGDAPLKLEAGETTCSRCTIAKLEKDRLEPGQTGGVEVEYHPTFSQPKFRQHATIRTNDPEHPLLDLNISGVVTTRYAFFPQYLVLSKFSSKEGKTAEIKIVDYLSDNVTVENYEFTNQRTSDFFEATIEPIPYDQLGEKKARSGCRVRVTVKPGLPIGPFQQTIRLKLNLAGSADHPQFEVPIEGLVDSDISIVGRDWNSDAGRLQLGAVQRGEGAKRTLFFMLRGPLRHETTIKTATIEPSWVKVTLGEPKELNTGEGGVTQIPVSVEIPPDAPPVNHLGTDQGKYAKVVFETTNPDAKQIKMYLQFVVIQ